MLLKLYFVYILLLVCILCLSLGQKVAEDSNTVIWCTIRPEEQQKCLSFARAVERDFGRFGSSAMKMECKQGFNKEDCMNYLDEESAHITSLDAGEIFVGGRYHSLIPIMQEIYPGGQKFYYSVAVLRKSNSNTTDVRHLRDLRGKRACFAGVGTQAGWVIPIYTMMREGGMEIIDCNNHVKSATNFFGPSCAVNSLIDKYNPIGDNSDKMCQLCIGKIPGGRCTSADPYAGFEGAFRCLVEAGDIAFLKHTTVGEMTSLSYDLSGVSQNDFELLCRDGTRRAVDEYRSCNWGNVPTHTIVTTSARSIEVRKNYQRFIKKAISLYGGPVGNKTYNRNDLFNRGSTDKYDRDSWRADRVGDNDRDRDRTTDRNSPFDRNSQFDRDRQFDPNRDRNSQFDPNRDRNSQFDPNRDRNSQVDRFDTTDRNSQFERNGDRNNQFDRNSGRSSQFDRDSDRNSGSDRDREWQTDRDRQGGRNWDEPYNSSDPNAVPYEEFKLFESAPRYGIHHNLLFQDAAVDILALEESQQTYKGYLGSSLDMILGVRQCPVNRMTLCVTSDPELEKCIKMRTALKAQLLKPDMACYKGHSQIHCMQAIKNGNADVAVLDAGDVYTAGLQHDLIPFVAEVYNLAEPEYYVVAVSKEEDPATDITYLKGKKTCHAGINTAAGWIIPLAYLISNNWIRSYGCNSVRAAAEYFSKSCVPGALSAEYNTGVPYDNMCDLCHGASFRYCRRDASEVYYGNTGAFRCLVEGGGDVAFVRHTTVMENTGGKRKEWWARNIYTDDYQLLCPDGTRGTTLGYRDCHLGKVKANAVVTRGGDGYNETQVKAFINLFIYSQQFYGRKDADDFSFSMFSSPEPYSDLIFQDATQQLLAIEPSKRSYGAYLGKDFLRARRVVDCAASADIAKLSILGSALMAVLVVLMSRGIL